MAKKTIKAQMKQRRDTKANWAATNPVLLDGELGIVSDDPNLYKVGDGTTAWNDLPFRGFDGTLAQELGTSPNAVISQKVVSEKLTELESEVRDNNNILKGDLYGKFSLQDRKDARLSLRCNLHGAISISIASNIASYFRLRFYAAEEEILYIESIYVGANSSSSKSVNLETIADRIEVENVNNATFDIDFNVGDSIKESVFDLQSELMPDISSLQQEVLPYAFIEENGNVKQTGNEGKVIKIPVVEGVKYRLDSTFGLTNRDYNFRVYAFYNSTNVSASTFVGGGEVYTAPYNIEDNVIYVIAPLGATYMAVHYKGNELKITKILVQEGVPAELEKTKQDVLLIESQTTPRASDALPIRGEYWYINGNMALGARIADDGSIITNEAGYSQGAALCFLSPTSKSIKFQTKAYAGSNVDGRFFAFYSTDNPSEIGASTLVEVSPYTTGVYSTKTLTDEISIPNNAKSFVVIYYKFDELKVSEVFPVNNRLENLEQDKIVRQAEVYNGTPTFFAKMADMAGSVGAESIRNYIKNTWTIKDSKVANAWAYSTPFNPDGAHLVHVRFKAKVADGSNPFYIYIAKGAGAGQGYYGSVATISKSGEYDVTIDASYYRVYQGFTDTFYVWIFRNQPIDIEISDFEIFQCLDEVQLSNINGSNSKDMFKSADDAITDLYKEVETPSYMIAPNGKKFVMDVDDNGNILAKPVIPTNVAYFGNSLMFGNSNGKIAFGMCASQKDKDFYTLVNSYIHGLGGSYVANKYSIVNFEILNNTDSIDSTIASMVANLSGNENLVVLQGGDNVAQANVPVFRIATTRLLKAIRAKCQNARVCWLAIWYSSSEKMSAVRNACNETGCTLVNIAELYTLENQSAIGNLIDFETSDSYTLENVSDIVANSATNISVTFTYEGKTATSTLDVDSYSLDGTTLTYTSRYKIVTLQASHPGDRGMKAIANKLLYTMGISNDEETYSLDS